MEAITTDSTDIKKDRKKIILFDDNKFDELDKVEKFLKTITDKIIKLGPHIYLWINGDLQKNYQ